MSVRQAAVAGLFYPQESLVLQNTVQGLLDKAAQHQTVPKVLVVPHAGLVYSGPIAASAYASLIRHNDKISKIIILGPAHTLYFKGIAYDPVKRFSTPLGEIEQDQELLNKISGLPYVHALTQAHTKEHCLEVQWPFCQMIFPRFTLLPLVVGETSPDEVAELIKTIWGGKETLIIISSDLSHYLPYEVAQITDRKTCLAIDTLDSEGILHDGACGYYPLRGFLHFAKENQIYGRLLDLRNSGDTAGNKNKVVGYAAYHFYEDLNFTEQCGTQLLYIARETLRLQAQENKQFSISYKEYSELLQIRIPTFITLKKKKMLRGCMGSLQTQERLASNIINNAMRAGFGDPRFPKLQVDELKDISLSISLLSPLSPMKFSSEDDLKSQLRPGIDGLVLVCNQHQATFLPSVWESLKTRDEFITQLKIKMGLSGDFWSPEMKALHYTVEMME